MTFISTSTRIPTATLCMPGYPPRHVCAAVRRFLLTFSTRVLTDSYLLLITWTLPRSSQVYTKTTDNQTEVTSTPFKHMLWWKGVNVT